MTSSVGFRVGVSDLLGLEIKGSQLTAGIRRDFVPPCKIELLKHLKMSANNPASVACTVTDSC